MSNYKKVYLSPDIDYVFCFLKKTIITEKECNYYEHNKKCDDNNNIFGRTHAKGSCSIAGYVGCAEPLLNECRYCLDKDKAKCYVLSHEAAELFYPEKEDKIKKFIKRMVNL